MKTMVIVNGVSANGKTGKLWPLIKNKLENAIGSFDFQFTEKQKSTSQTVSKALKNGYEKIICVGGDGTINETVNGFFINDKPVNKNAILTCITHGTGCDFKKTFGINEDLDSAINKIKINQTQMVDVGKIQYFDRNRQKLTRYFINIASFGMGGEISRNVNNMKFLKILGSKGIFYLATFYTMLFYRNIPASLQIEKERIEVKIRNIAVANGRFHGGGMMIAPDAVIDDGLLDIIILDDMSFLETLMLTGKIYQGTHIDLPKIKTFKAKKFNVTSEIPLSMEADGETCEMLNANFEILPRALKLQI